MTNGLSPLRLPVHTESGQSLGSVVDVSIHPDTQTIITYHVKPNRLVPDMVWSPLIIHREQIIQITDKGIVVDDAVSRTKQAAIEPQPTA